MDIVQAYLESLNWKMMISTGMRILLVLVFAWIVAGVVKRVLSHMEKRLMSKAQVEGEPPSESAKRIETLTRLIRQGVYLVLRSWSSWSSSRNSGSISRRFWPGRASSAWRWVSVPRTWCAT